MFTILDNIDNTYRVAFDASHPIYKAHFPNQPITPGVCILDMAHAVAERYAERKLKLGRLKNVKFISILDPIETPVVTIVVSQGAEEGQFNSVVSDENGAVIAKISAVYE